MLDPACGGAAFLAPVVRRRAATKVTQGTPAAKAVKQVLRELKGMHLRPANPERR
jgi:hypothetical protein